MSTKSIVLYQNKNSSSNNVPLCEGRDFPVEDLLQVLARVVHCARGGGVVPAVHERRRAAPAHIHFPRAHQSEHVLAGEAAVERDVSVSGINTDTRCYKNTDICRVRYSSSVVQSIGSCKSVDVFYLPVR